MLQDGGKDHKEQALFHRVAQSPGRALLQSVVAAYHGSA